MKNLVTEIKTRWYWYNYELHYDVLTMLRKGTVAVTAHNVDDTTEYNSA